MSALALRLSGVHFGFPGGPPLLGGVDLHLAPGWTGLVGANGAGKTTLLRVLAGELPVPGRSLQPSTARVHRLLQRLDAPGDDVLTFAAAWDKHALRLQGRLALDAEALDRWPTLSPGERQRWQLGAVLWTEPDVLLLDEPGNHLDLDATERLGEVLRGFRGIGVLVSHDRSLLDGVTTRSVRLRDGRLDTVDGPWTVAEQVWSEQDAHLLQALEHAQQERKRAHRQVQAARQRHDAATRSRSLRGAPIRDHDARSMGATIRTAKAERSHSKTLVRALTGAERAEQALSELERPEDLGRTLVFPHTPCRRRVVASLRAEQVGVAGRRLLGPVDLTVGRDARVWISGTNGVGKSTLVAELLARTDLPPERMLVLPQELEAAGIDTLVRRLHALDAERKGHVLGLLAALGVPPAAVLRSERPSPGEARKLALSLGLAGDLWLLVLDEPTHHLDLPSRTRLEQALVAYPGALLLVSHDRALAAAVCRTRWHLQDGRLEVRTV